MTRTSPATPRMSYGPQTLFELIIPITCTIFGVGFGISWWYLRQQSYLGWTALAALAFAVGVCVQLYNVPSSLHANSGVAATLFLLGVWALGRGIASRLGARPGNLLALLVYIVTTGLMLHFSSSLEVFRNHRFYTMNFGLGAMMLLPFWRMALHWPRKRVDQLLLLLYWLTALQFFVRTLLSLPPGSTFDNAQFVHSIQWQLINVIMFVVSLLFFAAVTGATVVDLTDALREERNRDPLTRALNRRGFDERVSDARGTLWKTSGSPDARPAVLMCDLDHFKRINDTHGHQAGDAVLKAFADLLARHFRAPDLVARFGGEEFLVFAPGIGQDGALRRANAIRQEMAQLSVPGLPEDVHVTVSIGLACMGPHENLDSTIKRADELLYRAKREGRNRVAADDAPA